MPSNPVLVAYRIAMRMLRPSLLLIALAALLPAARSADSPWITATAEELSPQWKPLERDAAVEALLWRIEVDDKRYPEDRRTTEYRRYKIFTPEKANDVMRISRTNITVNGLPARRYDIRARLTQPDGTTRELGKESILSRPAARTRRDRDEWGDVGSEIERTEKYLAISGAQPGAILEVQIEERATYARAMTTTVLQLEEVPVRKLEYTLRSGNATDYAHRFFAMNIGQAKVTDDPKHQICRVVGENLPPMVDEPFSGARSDYALTVFSAYTPYEMGALASGGGGYVREIDPKAGPWAVFASIARWMEEDRSEPTRNVKKAAAEITRGAPDDFEKAQRIHRKVQALYQEFARRAKSRESFTHRRDAGPSLDHVLDLGKDMDPRMEADDFLFLALSLYRAAGLKAEALLLPDREVARLDRRMPSAAFIPDWCVAIRLGEQWRFSMPNTRAPLPFGQLPWKNQGQGGLLAHENREDFIDVPLGTADQSSISNFGIFSIKEDGTLTGDMRRLFTGQHAYRVRSDLLNQDFEHQQAVLKEDLNPEFKGADVSVTKIEHLDDAAEPVDVTYHLEWPGYAVVTGERLIVRPSVFRAQSAPPFTATTRRNRIILPFRWKETDRLMITLPPGFRPESMALPPSYPGDVLGYRVAMSFEDAKRTLHLRRDFQTSVITVPVENYSEIKKWYDAVANSDQHELVFIKSDAGAGSDTGAAP